MIITLSPVRSDAPLSLARTGTALILNDEAVDLVTYDPEVAPCDWIVGRPEQIGGVWHLTLILPHGAEATDETRFPGPITLTGDGPVDLPPYDAPETTANEEN